MKYIKLITILLLIVTKVNAQNANDIIGKWESNEDGNHSRLEFFRNGNEYNAKILWDDKIVEKDGKTSKKDTNNPNEKFRTRNIIGITNLTKLKYAKNGEYIGGRIYNALNGQTYNCKVWIKDGELYLRGYFGVSLLGKTVKFYRYN